MIGTITDFFGNAWERVTKGPIDSIVITCAEADYEMGMGMKRSIFEDTDGAIAVKLIMGEKLSFDNGDEIQLEDGTMAISYIHEGNMIARPSISTYTMTYEKEEN